MKKIVYPIIFTALFPVSAIAQEFPYVDDRSGPAKLIESFYNAVNRKEYGRAWSYFGDTKPSADFAGFSSGYSQTSEIAVETGRVSEEGAAGSVYYSVPVAILAYSQDGSDKVFAGCYRLRLADPAVQGQDFRPLQIEKGALKSVETEFADSVPETCGDGQPAPPRDLAMEAAKRQFAANDAAQCGTANPVTSDPAYPIDRYEFTYRSQYDAETDPERKVVLFRFFCMSGAYNEQHLYYLYTGDEMDGLQQVAFAEPDVTPKYAGDDDTRVEALPVTGYSSRLRITNSTFDPTARSITEHALWRGLGDAATTARWVFREGKFVLDRYDVDATFDDEINPQNIFQARQ
jgi:hypothetical protein